MKFIKQLRERWGFWKLRRMSAEVQRERAQNIRWSEKPTIGLLYFHRPEEEAKLHQWVEHKAKSGFKVRSLGFMELEKGEELPASGLRYEYFSQKELNWFYQPVSAAVKSFIESDFDVLIDLDRIGRLPIRYALQQSKARMKIGRCGEEVPFDLCFEVDRSTDIESFLAITEQYLNMMDPTQNKAS